ncbi:hypothetical protein [Xanthomonas arboricola]|uniref:hypothetical protein n=1 Tax=Xanthomonas arboricola TaxID=56448 RepID=UPI001379BEDE|nr:hypothetical protein [Xanthomonas arboricola]
MIFLTVCQEIPDMKGELKRARRNSVTVFVAAALCGPRRGFRMTDTAIAAAIAQTSSL